jgi:phosphotransacetylase
MHCAQRSGGESAIVFAEGEDPKILRAAVRLVHEKIALPILLGGPR